MKITCKTRVHAYTRRKFHCRGQTQVSHLSFSPTCVSSDWNVSSHHDLWLANLELVSIILSNHTEAYLAGCLARNSLSRDTDLK